MLILPPDVDAFLAGWLRDQLTASGHATKVGLREPSDWVGGELVVIRDDGGPQTGYTTYARAIGVSVLAGTREDRRPAKALARLVYALLTNAAVALAPGSPIAAVDLESCTGPYAVPETHDTTRLHMTIAYLATGDLAPDTNAAQAA